MFLLAMFLQFSTVFSEFGTMFMSYLIHSNQCVVIWHCDFNLQLPKGKWCWTSDYFSICVSSLVKCLLMSFAYFVTVLCVFLLRVLYMCFKLVPYWMFILWLFFYVACLVIFLTGCFIIELLIIEIVFITVSHLLKDFSNIFLSDLWLHFIHVFMVLLN